MIAVPETVWHETLRVLRTCGSGRRECVAYWVRPASEPARVTRMVHPEHHATATHYRVDDAWLTQFWIELAHSGESVSVQVHTHSGLAGHSHTDDEGALVYQTGFLSLVLPGFAIQDHCRDDAYLAELDAAGHWVAVAMEERLRWK